MNFYKTSEVVRIGGVVGLSDAQAKVRAGRLAPVEKRVGVYTLAQPLDFKAGELIGLDEVPKGLIRKLAGGDSGGEPTVFDANGAEVKQPEKKTAPKPVAGKSASKDSGGDQK